MHESKNNPRIEGYDLARGLAIIGMVFVNFRVVLQLMGADVTGTGAGSWIANWVTGRAAATFVLLAGLGVALLTQQAVDDTAKRQSAKWRLLARAFFLAVIGWPFFTVWEGDILHYYAAFFLTGALVFYWPIRWLLSATGIITLLALPVLLVWERHWDFSSMTYNSLWTLDGQLMNFFLNGFHPLIPWLAFLLLGLALGRHLNRQPKDAPKLGFIALAVALGSELISTVLVQWAIQNGMDTTEAKALLGVSPMPPLPQYILAAGGCAVAVICGCRWLGEKLQGNLILRPFNHLGQMALTVYIVHVFAGVFPLFIFTSKNPDYWTLGRCVAATTAFCALATVFATAWRHWLPQGPVEWLMRRFSDFTDRRRWLALATSGALMGIIVTGMHTLEIQRVNENINTFSQSLPDEKEFEARCTRWVIAKFFFSDDNVYETWARKHFGSKSNFEDEWLTQMYFEYAKEQPMDETDFQDWLSAKVEERIEVGNK